MEGNDRSITWIELDITGQRSYIERMRNAEHRTRDVTPTELLLRRMVFHESLANFQTAAMFVFALVVVGGSFLSHGQAWPLMSDFRSVALLAGCTALIFFAGLYAMQRVTAWRVGGEARLLIQRNRTNLAEIEAALKLHAYDGNKRPKPSKKR